jgi:hypothetical protein
LGTLKWDFEKNDIENLGIVLYFTDVFSGKCVLENREKEEEDL